ncbi:MAG: hypothetical protein L0226_06650 [Acidobacteria bacterium]|nr:hypothetical protein [Acidobacteriota bacterium]
MKFVSSPIRSSARPFILTALLLAFVSFGLSRWGLNLRHESALAQTTVTVVNAASFDNSANKAISPDTIAAAFGTFVTQNNQNFFAGPLPLPVTLGGVSVTINGTRAALFFASTGQLNILIPANIQDGDAMIVVTNSDNTTRTGTFRVERASPGVFSARSTGTGTAAALTTTDGVSYLPVFNPDGSERDVNAGTRTAPNFLILYTTGIRYTPAANPTDGNGVAESVSVTLQGVPARVDFAGPVRDFVGLDQINLVIPPEMSGLGRSLGPVNVVVTANSRSSNAVTIKIGGDLPNVNLTSIVFGETKTSELTADDQIQAAGSKLFFFDAYDFMTTAPNTTVAIDLRSSQLESFLLLYRLEGANLIPIGFDEDTGGLGDGDYVNDNALLLNVIQNPGRYVIFVTTEDEQPVGVGAYTLKLTSITAPQLNYGQSVGDATMVTSDLQTSAGDFVDVYWFNGAQNDNVRINMNSSAFDSLIIMQSNDNEDFFAADDGGGGLNAQLTQRLSRSTIYLILATPLAPNVTGAYTLSLTRLTSSLLEGGNAFEPFSPSGREIHRGRVKLPGTGRSGLERSSRGRIIDQ